MNSNNWKWKNIPFIPDVAKNTTYKFDRPAHFRWAVETSHIIDELQVSEGVIVPPNLEYLPEYNIVKQRKHLFEKIVFVSDYN